MLHVIWKLFLICTIHDIRDKRFQHSRQLSQASEKCSNFALGNQKKETRPLPPPFPVGREPEGKSLPTQGDLEGLTPL